VRKETAFAFAECILCCVKGTSRMNWAWAASLDQFWRSPTIPMWLSLAAAGFFAIIVLITLLRAEKSVANGVLTVITLLAIGVAGAATMGGFGPGGQGASGETRSPPPAMTAALPALSCIDDLAGETVLTACEKTLFGSPENAAAALAYAASQISRLTASGDVDAASKHPTPELEWLRRSVERDRYGLMAYVLLVRDHCTPSDCAAFRALTDRRQIVANMDERTYDGLIMRYSGSWGAPAAVAPAITALPPTMPTGRPTNADFPTAASTPPVNIMVPEPGTAPPASSRPPAAMATAPLPSPRPASTTAQAPTVAKKPAPKSSRAAPVQLAPAPGAPAAPAPTPAADND
jgi:hypothetical protein